MMDEKAPIAQQSDDVSRTNSRKLTLNSPMGKVILLIGSFIILFITLHFLFPALPAAAFAAFPKTINLLNRFPIRSDYFFGLILSGGVAFLLAYHPHLLKKIAKLIGLFIVSFIVLLITLYFLFPALPATTFSAFPETVYLFDIAITSSNFFSLIIALAVATLFAFSPSKLKAIMKFAFSFWGFKAVLTILDILIFRNLLRASDADYFMMWTIPLLFAFLTNFLPFFFAVAFKTHQEGFEDKQEAGRVKKASRLRQRLSSEQEREDNRMKKASRIFLWGTALILMISGYLITNQRWLQMNQSLHGSLAHFEDTGPHTILIDGTRWYIENPPLDELSSFALMQNFWHLNENGLPVYGRYQQFLIDFTLLVLPILLIFVTILASYFNVPHSITNKWYQILEEITDRKKKKMRVALAAFEEAKARYEGSKLEYEQVILERNSLMRKLQVLVGVPEQEAVLSDVTTFEKACREAILENSLRTTLNSYDTHLNNLQAWILSDLEVFKTKMATGHQEAAISHAVLTIDLNEIINTYNKTVEPIKQFDTPMKAEALKLRLKMMNQVRAEIGDQEYE